MNQDIRLFRFAAKVRPTPLHPKYYELQFGFLLCFLLDETEPAARRRADIIIGQLPYEVMAAKDGQKKIATYTDDHVLREWEAVIFADAEDSARIIGIGLGLRWLNTGADEELLALDFPDL